MIQKVIMCIIIKVSSTKEIERRKNIGNEFKSHLEKYITQINKPIKDAQEHRLCRPIRRRRRCLRRPFLFPSFHFTPTAE